MFLQPSRFIPSLRTHNKHLLSTQIEGGDHPKIKRNETNGHLIIKVRPWKN